MKYTISFLIAKKKTDTDTHRLRCRVSFSGHRVEFNLGYRVTEEGWNADTQRCRRNSMHGRFTAQKINAEIDRYEEKINGIMGTYEAITPDMLRSAFREKDSRPALVSDTIEKFIGIESTHWSDATVKKFNTLKAHLISYGYDVPISEVTVGWMERYTATINKTLNNSSVNKELKNVRWFLRWALARGYDISKDASEWSPRLKTAPRRVIFLEWEELMKVYNYEFKNLHHAEVRDCFCFCCFTGLRYSDLRALMRSDIHGDMMSVTTIKTGELIDIPLNDYAKAILDIYKDDDHLRGRALPVCNNVEMNEALKEVMQIAGIDDEVRLTTYKGTRRVDEVYKKWEVMTTHCGRRTFVCNALMMGVSAEVVMSITGHSSYSSMKPYIAVADSAKRQAMELFNRRDT